jgi:biotin carboxyl carrier protein
VPAPPQVRPIIQSRGYADDVSVDLSQHLDIDAEDVKEAVRQSQAIAIPEISEHYEEPPAAQPPPTRVGYESGPQPAPLRTFAGSEPITLGGTAPPPVSVAIRPTTDAEAFAGGTTSERGSRAWVWLLLLLFLAALGAGGWWYVENYGLPWEWESGSEEAVSSTVPTPSPSPEKEMAPEKAGSPSPAQPAISETPEAKLETAANSEQIIKSARAGTVIWLPQAGASVQRGDVVVKFDGFLDAERKLKEDAESGARYQTKLDKATADGNKKEMQRYEAEVNRKQNDIKVDRTKLAELTITAPFAGTIELRVEPGAVVKPEQALVRMTGSSGPRASFQVEKPEKFEVGKPARVAPKDDPSMVVECKVIGVEEKKVSVACPEDSGMSAGTVIKLL